MDNVIGKSRPASQVLTWTPVIVGGVDFDLKDWGVIVPTGSVYVFLFASAPNYLLSRPDKMHDHRVWHLVFRLDSV
jgi:hypothetical protein